MGGQRGAVSLAVGIAVLTWPGPAVAQSSGGAAAGASLCIVRAFDPGVSSPAGGQTLVAWVSVPQPTRVTIMASADGDGPLDARLTIEVMRDGTRRVGADGEADNGALKARVSVRDDLLPGRQYRYVARADLRDTRLTGMHFAITSGLGCG